MQNGVSDASVSWNFNKFLVDENGTWVAHHASRVDPMSSEITSFARRK
jgi:glutathione peroxidase